MADFEWVAFAASDTSWILIAFALGLGVKLFDLPPLIGFLLAGFVINQLGFSAGSTLQKVADLGVTLLLFTVGLKLHFSTLLRPQIWLVATAQSLIFVFTVSALLLVGLFTLVPAFSEMNLVQALLISFALNFF